MTIMLVALIGMMVVQGCKKKEHPEHPEIVLATGEETVEESAARVVLYLEQRGYVAKEPLTAEI